MSAGLLGTCAHLAAFDEAGITHHLLDPFPIWRLPSPHLLLQEDARRRTGLEDGSGRLVVRLQFRNGSLGQEGLHPPPRKVGDIPAAAVLFDAARRNTRPTMYSRLLVVGLATAVVHTCSYQPLLGTQLYSMSPSPQNPQEDCMGNHRGIVSTTKSPPPLPPIYCTMNRSILASSMSPMNTQSHIPVPVRTMNRWTSYTIDLSKRRLSTVVP